MSEQILEPSEQTITPDGKPLAVSIGTVSSVLDSILEPDPFKKDEPKDEPKDDAKTDEPPKDAPKDDGRDLPDKLPNEGRSDKWKQFRKEHEETKKQLEELRGQLTEFEGTKKEREELKTKIGEYETQISELRKIDSVAKLENDPDFRAKYVHAREAAIGKLKEYAELGDIQPNDLLSAMNKTGKERINALEEVLAVAPSILKGKITSLIDKVDDIDIGRRDELGKADESMKRLQLERQKAQERSASEYAERAEYAFKNTAAKLSKELGISEEVINQARDFFKKNDDLSKAAEVVIKAHYADKLSGSASEKDKKITELESELARYRESSPSIGSGADKRVDAGKDDDFITAIRKQAKAAGIF